MGLSGPHLFTSIVHHNFMFFLEPLLVQNIFSLYVEFLRKLSIWVPFKIQWTLISIRRSLSIYYILYINSASWSHEKMKASTQKQRAQRIVNLPPLLVAPRIPTGLLKSEYQAPYGTHLVAIIQIYGFIRLQNSTKLNRFLKHPQIGSILIVLWNSMIHIISQAA